MSVTPEAREAARKLWDEVWDAFERGHENDAVDVLAAFLSSWRPKWLPIESAPKDGTAILAWWLPIGETRVAWWESATEAWRSRDGWFNEVQFTHWQPLPSPPSREDLT